MTIASPTRISEDANANSRKIKMQRKEIEKYMHLSQKEAATALGVSCSTLRRRIMEYKLRWPRSKMEKKEQKECSDNGVPGQTSFAAPSYNTEKYQLVAKDSYKKLIDENKMLKDCLQRLQSMFAYNQQQAAAVQQLHGVGMTSVIHHASGCPSSNSITSEHFGEQATAHYYQNSPDSTSGSTSSKNTSNSVSPPPVPGNNHAHFGAFPPCGLHSAVNDPVSGYQSSAADGFTTTSSYCPTVEATIMDGFGADHFVRGSPCDLFASEGDLE